MDLDDFHKSEDDSESVDSEEVSVEEGYVDANDIEEFMLEN